MRSLLSFLLLAVLVLPAQAGHPFGQPFSLNVGEFQWLGDDEVMIGFYRVSSDSRCPTGVWCFWEGDAATDLWLQIPGEPRLEFVLHTAYDFQHSIDLGPYSVSLLLVAPYPLVNVPIDPESYVVSLVVFMAPVDVEARTWGTIKALYR